MLRKIALTTLMILICPFAWATRCDPSLYYLVIENTSLPSGFELHVNPANSATKIDDSHAQSYHVYPNIGQSVTITLRNNKAIAQVALSLLPNGQCTSYTTVIPMGTIFSPCPAQGVTSDPFCLVTDTGSTATVSYPALIRLNPNSSVFQ